VRCSYELIAAIPEPVEIWGAPSTVTLAMLDQLGVRRVAIVNELELGRDFRHSNKFACIEVDTAADRLVFLDSDILCTREFTGDRRLDGPLSMKPADVQTYGGRRAWRRAYRAMGLTVPSVRLAATVSGERGPPYFNSGVIALEKHCGLGPAWREAAAKLRADRRVSRRARESDQPSLAMAVQLLGVPYLTLDEELNFPAHLRKLDAGRLPVFCHYHYPAVIRREPELARLVEHLVSEPDLQPMRELMRTVPEWCDERF
jgi:hypothetical protein